MDACSVYKITTRKCRVSVIALCGQSSKGTHKMTTGICFSSDFLLGKRSVQIVKWQKFHQRRLQTMLGDFWECSRVGCGDPGRGPIRPSHWQSRRTGGSGVSARCRTTPYYHLLTGGKQGRSQRVCVCDVIAHLLLLPSYHKNNCFDISSKILLKCCLLSQTFTVCCPFGISTVTEMRDVKILHCKKKKKKQGGCYLVQEVWWWWSVLWTPHQNIACPSPR